uniref:Gag-pol polyprotein n=1 Tax=Solanum tuberosum TaxID=4113 RepID=M1DLE9_SOLTU
MSNFLFGVADLVKTECRNAMLLGDMDISRLMTHAQQVEGDKLKEMTKDNKKARTCDYEYSQHKSGGKDNEVTRLSLQLQQVAPLNRVPRLVRVVGFTDREALRGLALELPKSGSSNLVTGKCTTRDTTVPQFVVRTTARITLCDLHFVILALHLLKAQFCPTFRSSTMDRNEVKDS